MIGARGSCAQSIACRLGFGHALAMLSSNHLAACPERVTGRSVAHTVYPRK
jgi:hypothetical protein